MVYVVYSHGALPQCEGLPAAPESAASAWELAAAAEQARPTLPAFSVLSARRHNELGDPGGTFKLFAAGLTTDSAAAAAAEQEAAESPCSLRSLVGPADALHLQPQPMEPATPVSQEAPGVPSFLLLRRRQLRANDWQQSACSTLDVPCLPGAASTSPALLKAGGLFSAFVRDCKVEPHAVPPELPPDGEKYRWRPELVTVRQPGASGAAYASGAEPFSLLDCMPLGEAGEHLPGAAEASPRLLDTPLLLGWWQGSTHSISGGSLRCQLGQLAADSWPQPAEAEAANLGFNSLQDMAPCRPPAASNAGPPPPAPPHLAAPALVQMAERRLPPALPAFLAAARPAQEAGAGASAAPAAAQLFTLQAPVLPALAGAARAAGPVLGAPLGAFASLLLQPVPVPQVAAAPTFVPAGCEPVSLASLVAQDMVLEEGGLMLPAVPIQEGAEEDGAEVAGSGRASLAGAVMLSLIQSECGRKPSSTAHLALYLDWSLSTQQDATRPPELAAALHSMQSKLLPQPVAPEAAVKVAAASRAQQHRAVLIEQMQAPWPRGAGQRQQLPDSNVVARLPVGHGSSTPTQGQPLAAMPGQKQKQAGAVGMADGGPPPAKRAKRVAGAADGMQYFLQLQRGKPGAEAGGATGAAGAGADAASPAGASSCSSDGMAAVLDQHQQRASTTVHAVELPPTHVQLLQLLQEDEARLVRSAPAPGVAPEAARSDFLSVDVVQRALEQAAGKPSQRNLLKVYAAMAVIRQAASQLVHHGICCAHMYLEQSQAELPGLLNAVTAARELRTAHQKVLAGQLEDSPKQAALQRVMAGIATCSPGAKCCVIGHPQTFFTLYRPALDSGQPGGRVCQLDREGRLLAGGTAGAPLAEAVLEAAASAGCLLVGAELAAREGFPFSAFQAVVVYASEPGSRAGLEAGLAGAQCPLHFLEAAPPSQQAQHGPAAAQGGGQLPPMAAPMAAPAAAPRGGAARVVHAVRPAAAPAVQLGRLDCPVIISSDPRRPIRYHRQLYEAVLGVEREGGAVVERRLSLVDVVLSPSAALVICDNSTSKLEFDAFLSALDPVLARLSYAFSRLVLVCEGTAGFQAQVLCGTERLLALGRGYGLHLQCHASASTETTGAIVGSVTRAWLVQWHALDPGLHYAVPEEPTEEEAFFTRFYSINPHTAALLMSLGLPLHQLLRLNSLTNPLQVPRALSLVPRHCLELLSQCASHGVPVLGIPSGSVMHQGYAQDAGQQALPAATPPKRMQTAGMGAYASPAQGSTMPDHGWLHQQQQQQRVAMAQDVPAVYGIRQHQHAHQQPLQQVYMQQAGAWQHPAYGLPDQAGLEPAAYLTDQITKGQQQQQQQKQRWGSGYKSNVQLDDDVYGRGMQLMQTRMGGPQGEAGAQAQHAAAAGPADWGHAQQAPMGCQLPQQPQYGLQPQQQAEWTQQQHQLQQQQQQQQLYRQQQQEQMYQQQQQDQVYRQQQEQQLLAQQQREQLLRQQQAEAEAFPDMPVSEWDQGGLGAGVAGQQQHMWMSGQPQQAAPQWQQQQQLHLSNGAPAQRASLPSAFGNVAAYLQDPNVQLLDQRQNQLTGGWQQQQQQQHGQGQQVDEFGVSLVAASLSDDESESNARAGTRAKLPLPAEQHQEAQTWRQALLPPRPGGVTGYGQAAMPAPGGLAGMAGVGPGHMGAFLSTRTRDFSVPRLTPQRQQEGLQAGDDINDGHPSAPGPKRQRGAAAVSATPPRSNSSGDDGHMNLLRPPAKRGGGGGAGGGGGGAGYRRGGGWGGGRWRGGGRGGRGLGSNKPSRAW